MLYPTTNPDVTATRVRLLDGMRHAGLPEGRTPELHLERSCQTGGRDAARARLRIWYGVSRKIRSYSAKSHHALTTSRL